MAGQSQGGSLLLTAVKWAVENDLFLSDLVQRCALPHLALVTKGQHLSVGAPNVANPALKPYLLVHSRQRLRKVLAQVVKLKEGKGQALTEQKLAIPESYPGYFEILSEDGRPVRCLESVSDLFQKFPEMCLVRQSCKAYVPDSDGELRSLYRTRTVTDGEVLTLVGQFNFKRSAFLRCFDEQGRSVYLKMSQKAKFSPVARRRDAIAGVHSMQNLMSKRLPLTVKLIHHGSAGAPPLPPEVAKSLAGGQFVLRLLSVFQEDAVFAYALHKPEGQFLCVPLSAHLKLAPALNHPQVMTHHEFREICRLCDDVLPAFLNRISIYNDHQLLFDQHRLQQEISDVSESDPDRLNVDADTDDEPDPTRSTGCWVELDEQPPPADVQTVAPTTVICDDEIDQLYDYIRGLAPLPDSCHQPRLLNGQSPASNGHAYKPPPPPVETIPSRKSTNSLSSPDALLSPSVSSPPQRHHRRHSPPRPRPSSGHQRDRRPPTPDNRARSPATLVVELRKRSPPRLSPAPVLSPPPPPPQQQQQHQQPLATTINGCASPAIVPEKRLDDIIYSKSDRLKRLSKSTEKLAYLDERCSSPHRLLVPPSYGAGDERPHQIYRQNQARKASYESQPQHHQYVRRGHGKPRPMSMVIPDSVPLFRAPVPPQPPLPPPPVHEFFKPPQFAPPVLAHADPYQRAYRSFVNLTVLDDEPPPPYYANGEQPPQPRSFYRNAVSNGRPVFPRYSPRYHYPAAYRV